MTKLKEITDRDIDAMARHIARNKVQQQWRELGHKRYDHSFRQLCEAADALIKQRPDELHGLARIALEGLRSGAKLSSHAQKPKPSNQSGISVQNSWSKWFGWRVG